MTNSTNLLDVAVDTMQPNTSAHETSKIFSFNGAEITFQKGADVMVNATEMGRPFGKKPIEWLRLPSTGEFMNALRNSKCENPTLTGNQGIVSNQSKLQKCTLTDNQSMNPSGGLTNELYGGLVVTVRGGSNPGTWMHEDVALEFARWLSPAFAIWTNDRIKELLTTGVTTVSNDDEMIAQAMLILQKRLDAQKQQVQILEGQTKIQQEQIRELAPKARYTDEVLQSTSTFTVSQIAKDWGMSAVTLNRKLRMAGIQFYQSGQWMLYAKYQDRGLTDMRIAKYWDDKAGEVKTYQSMVWTEKGRAFLHQLRKEGRI